MSEYDNETDYRKIPRELLNSNIPQGRGIVKWAPFATLPEQFEQIQQYIMDQNKIDRPILSEDQLSELNTQLHKALFQQQPVTIRYYDDGYIDTLACMITQVNRMTYEIECTLLSSNSPSKLSLFDILEIMVL